MKFLRRLAMWSVLYYIRFWARLALWIGRPITIGVAGSVGKSSTREVLLAMLSEQAKPRVTYGNSETGVPLGILNIDSGDSSARSWLKAMLMAPFKIFNLRPVSHLIIEMATDEPYPPKNMEYLLSIVRPQYSLLLNTFPIHTMQFAEALKEVPESQLAGWTDEQKRDFVIERLAEEDAKIITDNPGTIGIYYADNNLVSQQILRYLSEEPLADLYSFGRQADNDLSFGEYSISPSGSQFSLVVNQQAYLISIGKYLLPQEYLEVLGAALLTGIKLGFKTEELIESLHKHLHLPKGRASLFKGIKDSIIIDSSYNASASAVTAFAAMLKQLKQQTSRPAVIVLGDMREIGLAEAEEHYKVAEIVASTADQVYLVGRLTEAYVKPWLAEHAPNLPVQWSPNYTELHKTLTSSLPEKALLLIKGSQNTIFLEEVVKALLVDSADSKRLCRQEDFWLKRKEEWLQSQSLEIKK